ncbi:MAG: cytochrome c oxidase accessory protein CcoG, partial [Pedobacter sp.]
ELINKTNKAIKFKFRSADSKDEIKFIQVPEILAKEGTTHLTFFLIKKPENIETYKSDVEFEIVADGKVISTATTSFFSQP